MALLKLIWTAMSTRGTLLPHAYDASNDKPSVRLLFAYISFMVAMTSVISLHLWEHLLIPTWTAICFYVICTVLYMAKSIGKFSADLDEHSVSFEESSKPDSSTSVVTTTSTEILKKD